MPGLIYGLANNPLVDAGIQRPTSFALPALIKVALDRKQPGIVGKGLSLWPNVSNDDSERHIHNGHCRYYLTSLSAADLYVALFNAVIEYPDKTGHGREGYYFGENGEESWSNISRAIGEVLVELGIITDPEPTSFTEEELVKYFGSVVRS